MKYDYDIIVIGGGAAGLTAAGIAANLGCKTMMVEADRLGGDCTWTGCVPSKTLLKASKVAESMRNADRYGLTGQEPTIDFPKLMNHVRSKRADVYEEADHPDHFRDMGIDVVEGHARFIGSHRIVVEKNKEELGQYSAKNYIIATGSTPRIPGIDGIENVTYLTSESLFEIETQPERLIVVGAGPVGIEMGQAFNRLGTRVSIIDRSDRILSNDDTENAGMLRDILQKEGIEFSLDTSLQQIEQDSTVRLTGLRGTQKEKVSWDADRVLMAVGRRPNVQALGLEQAGVKYSQNGIEVDRRCRTSQRHIYACGDVTGEYQFTHMSEHMAKVAVTNALLKWPRKMDKDHVSWCTYTDPELAHVGKRKVVLNREDRHFKTYRFPYTMLDRAITDSNTDGLIKVYARPGGKILGASILGKNAGEMISEFALAISQGISLKQMADTIHPYPTYGLGNRRAADQWYIQNQSEWMVKAIQALFGYRGEVPDLSNPDRIV